MNTLALSCGGLYCTAHIGVIKYLREQNITIDHVVGCSGGAIIAAMYALEWDVEKMTQCFMERGRKIYDLNLLNIWNGLVKGSTLYKDFKRNFNGKMGDYPITIPITHAESGITITAPPEMPVVDALRASISVPGLFRPHVWEGQRFVDGGVYHRLPLRFVPEETTVLIASDLSNSIKENPNNNSFFINWFMSDLNIPEWYDWKADYDEALSRFPDLQLIPHFISNGNMFTDFHKIPEFVQTGYDNASVTLHQLNKAS